MKRFLSGLLAKISRDSKSVSASDDKPVPMSGDRPVPVSRNKPVLVSRDKPISVSQWLDLIYPPPKTCPLCGKTWSKQRGAAVCARCIGEIAELQADMVVCRHCGRFLARGSVVSRSGLADESVLFSQYIDQSGSQASVLTVENFCCADCRQNPPAFQMARAIGPFEGLLREAVYQLKYQGKLSLREPLGWLMAEVIRKEWAIKGPPLVVPVPLHPNRLAERGFNQAELLATAVARELGWRLHNQLLIRQVDTVSQTRLNRSERLINLQGAFAVRESDRTVRQEMINAGCAAEKQVRESDRTVRQPIVLVDDVLTSGTTSEECARVLQQAGYGPVMVITIATGKIA
jgi:predicted amidophosphoribosyltransferase